MNHGASRWHSVDRQLGDVQRPAHSRSPRVAEHHPTATDVILVEAASALDENLPQRQSEHSIPVRPTMFYSACSCLASPVIESQEEASCYCAATERDGTQ